MLHSEMADMLNESVLVLNRSWMVVHIASVRRAIGLVYKGLARVVNPEDFSTYDFYSWAEASAAAKGGYIPSVSIKFRVPEIVQLTFFNGFRGREVRFSRRSIFERDRNACQYCGKKFDRSELAVDHVVPRSRGGKTTWSNVVLACVKCNTRKGDRTPEEAGMGLVRRPVKPRWPTYIALRLGRSRKRSWEKFLSEAYWNVELEP